MLVVNLNIIIPTLVCHAKTQYEPGFCCQNCRYVYYACYSLEPTGIMRYDTKTGKKKEIFSSKKDGNDTNGFDHLTVSGKYIYCTWDVGAGTSALDAQQYIYRISKDGKKSERLACGYAPVIAGNRIIYQQSKLVTNEMGMVYTVSTGKTYSMKLDGTGKRKVKAPNIKLASLYSDIQNKSVNQTDPIKGYRFYKSENGKKLYRINTKTGKTQTIISSDSSIDYFYVSNDYIVYGVIKPNKKKTVAGISYYIVKTNGKKKKTLVAWKPVG